ncbi:hypothetical protein [Janthinobacterium lividum]|uniref:DUF4760 domain-containing protein n=1 Tax=Janthinobacterium lividum TaxID=29581 RepID=A0ABU0XRH3_9BURK|nr:hypothetical protein [Janthinobacterium lividum]MDQ4625041.1 hypothetical protein [Janthinobacterium lividum]MDQ4673356.1 hypothetical protein [Janthinobacterium lividum]MDQ4684086.1 hypothetical protein [Janthinobacterium lividum]
MKRTYWIVGIVLIAVLGAALYLGFRFSLTRPEWPGWVQAVGSIAAIVAAYFLGAAQVDAANQSALAAEQRAEAKRHASILAIGSAAILTVEALPELAHNNRGGHLAIGLTYDKRVFDSLISALGNIPVHELGSAKAVESFFVIKNTLIALQVKIDKFREQDIPAWEVLYPDGDGNEDTALKTEKIKLRLKQFFTILEGELVAR